MIWSDYHPPNINVIYPVLFSGWIDFEQLWVLSWGEDGEHWISDGSYEHVMVQNTKEAEKKMWKLAQEKKAEVDGKK